jgi:hypothetical protein
VAGAWRAVLSDALPFSFTDEPLRYGTRFYKVAIIEADGTEQPGSGLLMAAPEPLATDTTVGLPRTGNTNVAEIELLALSDDRTPLGPAIEEAEAIDPSRHTGEPATALEHARSGLADQEQADAAAERLRIALENV